MTMEMSHHIDASEPDADGFYEYHYECDVYEFTDGVMTLRARAYSDEPESAALMGWNKGKKGYRLTKRDLHHPLILEAAACLRTAGKTKIDWLDRNSRAYVPLIDPEV
jgi:hypothetical protein